MILPRPERILKRTFVNQTPALTLIISEVSQFKILMYYNCTF